MPTAIELLAAAYSASANAAANAAVEAEAEAQLTVPLSNLLSGLVSAALSGTLELIRETRLDRTRPDFAAIHVVGTRRYQKGFVELKAPGTSVDTSTWRGRNKRQWDKMKDEAEVLIICNGEEAQLYHHGAPVGGPAQLPLTAIVMDCRPPDCIAPALSGAEAYSCDARHRSVAQARVPHRRLARSPAVVT